MCKSSCAQLIWLSLAQGEGQNIFGYIIIGLIKVGTDYNGL